MKFYLHLKMKKMDINMLFTSIPEKDEPEAQAAIFDDEGGLFPIETPEEWELVEEVFQSFVSEEDEDETEYCEGEDEDCNS